MHKRHAQPVARRMRNNLRHSLLHEEAVWQAGQCIVVRQISHPLFGTLALSNVARGQYNTADAGMIKQVVSQGFEIDPGAIRVAKAQDQW